MNKVLLVGRLVRDPEGASTPSGVKYTRFTVAVNRTYGSDQQAADFVPIVAWRNTADFATQYLKKGLQVSVEGRFSSSSYVNKENQKVTRYEVVADNLRILDAKGSSEARETRATPPAGAQVVTRSGSSNLQFEGEQDATSSPSEEQDPIPWEIMDL